MRFCSWTSTVVPRKALKPLSLIASLFETLSRKRISATHPLRCVAVRREWILITAPGSNVTETGSCRIGMVSDFDRFLCVKGPCASGRAILRAVHHAWGRLAGRTKEGIKWTSLVSSRRTHWVCGKVTSVPDVCQAWSLPWEESRETVRGRPMTCREKVIMRPDGSKSV